MKFADTCIMFYKYAYGFFYSLWVFGYTTCFSKYIYRVYEKPC